MFSVLLPNMHPEFQFINSNCKCDELKSQSLNRIGAIDYPISNRFTLNGSFQNQEGTG